MTDVLRMPEPIGLQPTWLSSDAKYKLFRVGRRGTKTRYCFMSAILGHGPGWEESKPKFGGVLSGGDVVWICPTYSNLSTVLWNEEIEPRMGHLPWVSLNRTLHDVDIPGLGSLMLRSGDRSAIDSIRGIGSRLRGVVIDEAAHMDLRGALQDVILPALLDNDGWLILASTTNAGPDGGYDDTGAPQVPSYFNQICAQIQKGQRSKDWVEFVGTAFDNPTLSKSAIDALIAEYPPDSPKLKQEVFAELLETSIGLALPGLSEATHMVDAFYPPAHWNTFAAFDWGYHHPWSFGLYVVNEDGHVYKRDTISGRRDLPEQLDAKVRNMGIDPSSLVIHAGPDVWQTRIDKGGKIKGQYLGPTVAEQLQILGWQLLPAANARVAGLNNFRQYIYIDPEKKNIPRFQWMRTPGNTTCLEQCARMTLDPMNPEDALKVDADAAGRGGDDFYDECIPGETLVVTDRGPQTIASMVGTSGKVLTPIGWLGYDAVRQTRAAAEVWRLTTVSGRSMVATANHEVLTNDGWRPVGDFGDEAGVSGTVLLADLDGILSPSHAMAPSRSVGGDAWANSRRNGDPSSGWEPGEQPTGKPGNAGAPDAPPSSQGNRRTPSAETGARGQDPTDDEGVARQRGGSAKPLARGESDVAEDHVPYRDLSAVWTRISDTPYRDDQILPPELQGQGIAGTSEAIARVEYVGVAAVYNMEVETAHCYTLASGFVVHNCRYGLMSRPILAKVPVKPHEEGRTLGYDFKNRKPAERKTADQEMAELLFGQDTSPMVGRFNIPERRGL